MNINKAKKMHNMKLLYVKNTNIFNGKGSNEIWQVAGIYGKWQQGMGCKVKSKQKKEILPVL